MVFWRKGSCDPHRALVAPTAHPSRCCSAGAGHRRPPERRHARPLLRHTGTGGSTSLNAGAWAFASKGRTRSLPPTVPAEGGGSPSPTRTVVCCARCSPSTRCGDSRGCGEEAGRARHRLRSPADVDTGTRRPLKSKGCSPLDRLPRPPRLGRRGDAPGGEGPGLLVWTVASRRLVTQSARPSDAAKDADTPSSSPHRHPRRPPRPPRRPARRPRTGQHCVVRGPRHPPRSSGALIVAGRRTRARNWSELTQSGRLLPPGHPGRARFAHPLAWWIWALGGPAVAVSRVGQPASGCWPSASWSSWCSTGGTLEARPGSLTVIGVVAAVVMQLAGRLGGLRFRGATGLRCWSMPRGPLLPDWLGSIRLGGPITAEARHRGCRGATLAAISSSWPPPASRPARGGCSLCRPASTTSAQRRGHRPGIMRPG